MKLNWERKDKDIPHVVIQGSTNISHGHIKSFYPPQGVKLKVDLCKDENGVDQFIITWGHKPTAEQVEEIIPDQLDAAQLEVHAAKEGLDPTNKSSMEILEELPSPPAVPKDTEFTD